MNQIALLHKYLKKAHSLSLEHPQMPAEQGWFEILPCFSIFELHQHLTEYKNIALKLHHYLEVEHNLSDDTDKGDFDEDWIVGVLNALSSQGSMVSIFSSFEKASLKTLSAHARSWNHGYVVKSSLDEDAILSLIEKLRIERDIITNDTNLSFDFKRVILIEIDNLINALVNFDTLGEEKIKEAVTVFCANAYKNEDIGNYVKNNLNFRQLISDIDSTITIASFMAPAIPMLMGVVNAIAS